LTTPVAFVLKGYPRLSETFIAQEIHELERLGLDIRIVSLRHPTDRKVHPVHRQIAAPTNYLPEYLHYEPMRVFRAWQAVRRWPAYGRARAQWLRDLARDRTPNRVRRFGQALVLAHELDPDIGHLHAHFLHTPASVTRYAAILTGLPWSCSAHAKDIWTTPEWEKREKLADLSWLVTCSRTAADHLAALAPADNARGTVDLVYHGIDLDRFVPAQRPADPHAIGTSERPLRLLSVGRAVEKKGLDDLIDALAQLPGDLHWRLTHIGGGKLLSALGRHAARVGVADRIDWQGAQGQDAVLQAYRDADVFVLASRVAGDGDRDGLPNVLLEAQSQGLACVATEVSAIPELIDDGETGLLVPPRNPAALAVAIDRLAREPDLRRRLADAGQARVVSDFSHRQLIGRLADKFGLAADRQHDRATA